MKTYTKAIVELVKGERDGTSPPQQNGNGGQEL